MTITLASVANPDFFDRPQPVIRPFKVPVRDLREAVQVGRDFIQKFGLGGGNWGPPAGEIRRGRKVVAQMSYNGRLWEPGRWPTPEILP